MFNEPNRLQIPTHEAENMDYFRRYRRQFASLKTRKSRLVMMSVSITSDRY
jgi:hypothetical protein